jgi:hypothetical protein
MSLRNDDLDPTVRSSEREALVRIALRLHDERPIPAPGFRGELRREIVRRQPASRWSRAATRRLAFGSLVSGLALLGLAAVGLADVGPLAPSAPSEAIGWIVSSL